MLYVKKDKLRKKAVLLCLLSEYHFFRNKSKQFAKSPINT